jgi:hypothetical protein
MFLQPFAQTLRVSVHQSNAKLDKSAQQHQSITVNHPRAAKQDMRRPPDQVLDYMVLAGRKNGVGRTGSE